MRRTIKIMNSTALTEDQILTCLRNTMCFGQVQLTVDVGPYDIAQPTAAAVELVREIERAHGIDFPTSPHP